MCKPCVHVVNMVPSKNGMFTIPWSNKQGVQDLEVHKGRIACEQGMQEHTRRMHVAHVKRCLIPKCNICEPCLMGKMNKGDGIKGPSAPTQELELVFDLIGPMVESNNGNVYKLVGCEAHTGYGHSVGLKDKSSKTVLRGVQAILARIRVAHNKTDKVSMRFHSDKDKSFMGEVETYIQEQPWLQTMTEGYDSNGNAIVERRNEKLDQGLRALLLEATGGRLYYEELWDEAMNHVHNLVNHMPEAGGKTPAQLAGQHSLDIDNMVECFGALAYYYEAPPRRSTRGHQTDTPGRMAICVGRSKVISGGHRVIPVECRKGVWHLGPTIERSYVVVKQNKYPLRTLPAKGENPADFEKYVDKCSLTAELSDIYVVDKILGSRIKAGEVEYKVKWRGWSMRETTWEPQGHLLNHGSEEIVREYLQKNKDKDDLKIVAYMIREVKHRTELDKTVSYLMKRHKLKGTLADWRPGYTAELDEVLARRCTEITGDEYKRVMKDEKVVSLRMNPEPKKTGRNKMRLIVKGFMEPPEWDGKTDSPTAMSSTVRQLIAMGRAEVIDGDLYMEAA